MYSWAGHLHLPRGISRRNSCSEVAFGCREAVPITLLSGKSSWEILQLQKNGKASCGVTRGSGREGKEENCPKVEQALGSPWAPFKDSQAVSLDARENQTANRAE